MLLNKLQIIKSNAGKLILQNYEQLRWTSSAMKFRIPSNRLPVQNGYLMDTRPKGEREVIESGWKPKIEGYKKPLRIEIIDRKDYDFIGQYNTWHFTKYSNIVKNIKYDEAAPLFFNLINNIIDKRFSFAAFEDDKLVGMLLSTFYTSDEFPEMYPRGLYEENPKFIIKEDYGQDITTGPFSSRKLNRMKVFFEESASQTGKFLPKDCKKLAMFRTTCIDPTYMGSGMAHYFGYKSMELFKKHGCDYWVSYSAAAAAAHFNIKVGGKALYEFPYEDFKDDGKAVFTNMYDGAKSLKTILGKVNETWPIVQKYS